MLLDVYKSYNIFVSEQTIVQFCEPKYKIKHYSQLYKTFVMHSIFNP